MTLLHGQTPRRRMRTEVYTYTLTGETSQTAGSRGVQGRVTGTYGHAHRSHARRCRLHTPPPPTHRVDALAGWIRMSSAHGPTWPRHGPAMACMQCVCCPDTVQWVYDQREPAAPAPPVHASSQPVTQACARGSARSCTPSGVCNYCVGRMHEGSWAGACNNARQCWRPGANSPPVLWRRALRSHTGRVYGGFASNGLMPCCFLESWARRATHARDSGLRAGVAGHSVGELRTVEPPASLAQGACVAFCAPTWREDQSLCWMTRCGATACIDIDE